MVEGDEEKMACFESIVLRRLYGPNVENKGFRMRTNGEIKEIYQKPVMNAYFMSKQIE